MPQTQTAQVANYDFGAPAASARVLLFRVRSGGKIDLKFENANGEATFNVTARVAPSDPLAVVPAPDYDNEKLLGPNQPGAFVNTSVADNGAAIVGVAVPFKQSVEFTINLRQGKDEFLEILAWGGARGQLQVRGNVGAEIQRI